MRAQLGSFLAERLLMTLFRKGVPDEGRNDQTKECHEQPFGEERAEVTQISVAE